MREQAGDRCSERAVEFMVRPLDLRFLGEQLRAGIGVAKNLGQAMKKLKDLYLVAGSCLNGLVLKRSSVS